MRPGHLLLALAMLLPLQAGAEIKNYELDILTILNQTTLTVTGNTESQAGLQGFATIRDVSNGVPTLETFAMTQNAPSTVRTDVFAGLNSFIYSRLVGTFKPLDGQTGVGDTAGFLKWNPLSSWTSFGGRFCKSSNEIGNPLGGQICVVIDRPFEMTQPTTIGSPNYDFPLWTFDAEGDFSSDGYLWNIDANGSSNQEWFSRGTLQINIPAMSMIGFGVLSAALFFLGVRTLRSRKPRQK